MKLNQSGIELIKRFEGLSLQVYHDMVGLLTVGYGHRTNLPWGEQITQQQADDMLTTDLDAVSDQLKAVLKVELTDNQFSALVSFVYNLGIGAFQHSTLCKLVNTRCVSQASLEFEKWDHAGGKIVSGLLRRRIAERDLFLL